MSKRRDIIIYGEFTSESREQWQCSRKRKYSNQRQANYQLALMKRHVASTELLKTYKCEYCRKWHIGNINPKFKDVDRSIGRRRWFKNEFK